MFNFVVYTPPLKHNIGGIVVLHNLAKELLVLKVKTFLYTGYAPYKNDFCNNFILKSKSQIINDENTIVIYPEIIKGNPLNAKYVVRWLLCDVGIHTDKEIYKTWGKDDLVFHYSTFNMKYNPEKITQLYTIWINPNVKNTNPTEQRSGSCYMIRKGNQFHKTIKNMHPSDSILLDKNSLEDNIKIFNEKEYFYCYDPYSFYDSIAALCGCIPIIYPLENSNKLDWLKTKGLFQVYLNQRDNLSGIAYGNEPIEIEYAKNTLHLASQEKQDALNFGLETIKKFVKLSTEYFDNKDLNKKYNTVERVFYTDDLLNK